MSKTRSNARRDSLEHIQKLLGQKGSYALNLTQEAILEEKIESKDAQKALSYFAANWRDTSRPALLSLVCESVGGNPESTTQIAVALSLISGGYDIHDDIIDGSLSKNGKITVLGKFGKDTTLLVGDALVLKGFTRLNKSLNDVPLQKRTLILNIVRKMFFELFDAEMLELQLRGKFDIEPENYLKIIRKKAGDVEAHTRIAAIIGEAKKQEIEALGRFGRALGMLIILRDEFIDVYDLDEAINRYTNEHLPLPVIYALQNQEAKISLSNLLSNRPLTKSDVKKILEKTKAAKGFNKTDQSMKVILKDAISSVTSIRRNRSLRTLAQAIANLPMNRE